MSRQHERPNGLRTWCNAATVAAVPSKARQNGRATVDGPLDATNLALLGQLQENARLTLAELGRRVGRSSPAVAERLERLERGGVILGHRTEVDPRALGLALTAVIRIRPAPG